MRLGQFDTWRKVMLAGAVLLLIISILDARRGTQGSGLLYTIATGIGYGFIVSGFSLAMRQRSLNKAERNKPKKTRTTSEVGEEENAATRSVEES